MAWTPQAQLTKSATRASANSTENTAASLANLSCAMSKLFKRTVSSPHDLMAGATGLEPAASCVTRRLRPRKQTTDDFYVLRRPSRTCAALRVTAQREYVLQTYKYRGNCQT